MDDPFVSCPYEPKHRIPQSRIQGHIVKCQQKYPPLSICPYNATHRLPEKEMKVHVETCPTRVKSFMKQNSNAVKAALTKPKPILQCEYLSENDPNHDIWDD